MYATLVLLATVGVLVVPSTAQNAGDGSTPALHIASHGKDHLEVVYFSNNLGIRLAIGEGSFFISSNDGQVLANFEKPIHVYNNDLYQILNVKGANFLDHKKGNTRASYSIKTEEAEKLKKYQNDLSKFESIANQIEQDAMKVEEQAHVRMFKEAVEDLLSSSHIQLIVDASVTIGRDIGITGYENPFMMKFYSFSKVIAKLVNDPSKAQAPASSISEGCKQYLHCSETCPPCKNEECIGLCGANCFCWPWVCGDCCWHAGCCEHDICCMRNGYISIQCLNVLGRITCSSYKESC